MLVARTGYVRISSANNENIETLENQKNIILDYIKNKQDFKLINFYEDYAKTGRNFNRTGFEMLMQDVKDGKIDCIIVKDLSRFGRDYKDCSNYIQNIFPFLNVRFIAINDNFDSMYNNDVMIMNLKNVVNEIYSKDISKKVLSSLKTRKASGQYMTTNAPYGYFKDSKNKGKVIVDSYASTVVKHIFELRAKNYSIKQILNELEEKNIDAPYKYFYKLGYFKTDKYKDVKWSKQTINSILKNDFYIGNLSQNKCTQRVENGKQKKLLPKENWLVLENNHTPIISKQLFDKVQEINKGVTEKYFSNFDRNKNKDDENILKGIVECGCCGKILRRKINIKKNKTKEDYIEKRFVCDTHIKYNDRCAFKGIKEQDLLDEIFKQISNNNIATNSINNIFKNQLNDTKKTLLKQISETNNKILKNKNYIKFLYEEYIYKNLTKEQYIKNRNDLKTEQIQLTNIANNLNDDLKFIEDKLNNLKLEKINILTRDILLRVIHSIKVDENKNIKIIFK